MNHLETTPLELNRAIENATLPLGVEIELLQQISGVGKNGVIGILAEIGAEMNHSPNQKHLASWAGMCPGSNQSADHLDNFKRDKLVNYYKKQLVILGEELPELA